MIFSRYQASCLINKVIEGLDKPTNKVISDYTIRQSNYIKYTTDEKNRLYSIDYKSNLFRLEIRHDRHYDALNFNLRSHSHTIDGSFSLPFSFFKLFSPIWFKWRLLAIRIEKINKRKLAVEQQIKEQLDRENFNSAFVSAFPEKIDNILLGEDDDF
jgi:hypothetical protein